MTDRGGAIRLVGVSSFFLIHDLSYVVKYTDAY